MAKAKSSGKKNMSKSGLIQAIAEVVGEAATRKQIKAVVESLAAVGYKELKKSNVFVLPGFAKFVVVRRPARPARKGINPFTKEPTVFAAKPASKAVKARPVKAIKDAIA
jgi:DNA-binding protein HU-beta